MLLTSAEVPHFPDSNINSWQSVSGLLTFKFSLLYCSNFHSIWAYLYWTKLVLRYTACQATFGMGIGLLFWLFFPSALLATWYYPLLAQLPHLRQRGKSSVTNPTGAQPALALITHWFPELFASFYGKSPAWFLACSFFSFIDFTKSELCSTLQIFHHDIFITYCN